MVWQSALVRMGTGAGALWDVQRPVLRRAVFSVHFPWAFLAGLVWILSFLISYETPIRLCGILRWTGYPCMFCGLTRSFAAISQGAWTFAVRNAPLAVILYAGMVAVFLWNTAGLVTGRIIRPGYLLTRIPIKGYVIALIALLLVNWAYRLAMGLK